ncbi:bifunctional nuclease family protein [Candidatus Sumerlaeota bacterium]|nr:bifunctional nuclease family protein [Candidatus Sumerlaeota bacterium]
MKWTRLTARCTANLILNVIDGIGGKLERVVIDDLRDETFFGKLGIRLSDGREALIDSRPSDAIVLAIRRMAPIFVAEHVLDQIEQHQSQDEEE